MTRIKTVSREKYIIFKEKAEAFYEAMLSEFEATKHDNKRAVSCVSAAVHCAISWIDALAVFKLGRKSSDSNHIAAVVLLKEIKTTNEAEKTRICEDLYYLIEMKTPSEYEDTRISKGDAEDAVHACKKIHNFLKTELEKAENLR